MLPIHLPPITIHRRLSVHEVGEQIGYQIADYGIDQLHAAHRGRAIKIGVVDTGIDFEHRNGGDLSGRISDARDFTGDHVRSTADMHGHGTHVAGIIAAVVRNQIGTVGVAPEAQLFIAKALGGAGAGSDASVAEAIRWCAKHGCRVINCSLGSAVMSDLIDRAVDFATERGSLIVAAAGNVGRDDTVGWPAKHADVIAVGAIDQDQRLASFSSRGNEVDVVAPGVEIRSSYLRGQYAELSGTSMAAPWITGLIALRLGAAHTQTSQPVRNISAGDFLTHLRKHRVDLGPPGQDPGYGVGVPIAPDFVLDGLAGHDEDDDNTGGDAKSPICITIGDFTICSPPQPGAKIGVDWTA